MLKRRYEMLLPLKYNDGRAVPAEIFDQTREDLVNRFGAVSVQPDSILGIWVQEGER
jgi:hypothetical protein